MKRPSLKEQEYQLRQAAKRRGLRVRKDPRLAKTPYRAMNPRAARELHQPCPPRTITYILSKRRPKSRKVLDIRHEIREFDRMGLGWKYRKAHRDANRKQRDVLAVK